MSKDYNIILLDIQKEILETQEFTEGMGFQQFEEDRKTQKAVIRGLEIIGEAMKRFPKEFQLKYPNIIWREWIDFRNVLIHVYHAIDLDLVWSCVHNELPELHKHISEIMYREKNNPFTQEHLDLD